MVARAAAFFMRAGAVAFSMVEGAVGCFKGSTKLDDLLLWKLKITLIIVKEVLNSAEEKQRAIPAVRWWLHELKHGNMMPSPAEELWLQLKKAANDATTLLEELTHDHESISSIQGKKKVEWEVTANPRDIVYGRKLEEEKLFRLLAPCDEANAKRLELISISGPYSIGKTTLAQLAYNNILVRGFGFNFKNLLLPFRYVAKGSKIIVTTGDEERSCVHYKVTPLLDNVTLEPLQKLKGDDPWLLFAIHAFGREDDPSVDPELTTIGKDIVKKCDGLPLLIRELGILLGSSRNYREWDRTLKRLDQAKF
ncbi:hypothetical protein Tsubulata_022741 [Turnera subulata]|uniref:NB-ARC domain-containing protein n=1 Tax=Turnera subulata TaxID=218843 RepID=A0A9Q0F1P9_9ROSI|nr:hypothetical protein Tsubulata_022741 [Turnera subulata]